MLARQETSSNEKLLLSGVDDSNQSICVTDLLRAEDGCDKNHNGKQTNLMIYSTLAAAYPYAHKSNAKIEHQLLPLHV